MKRRTLPTVREEKVSRPGEWVIYGLVGFVSVACYANGTSGDFVHDDIPAITMNKDVLAQNPLSHVFKNDFWGTPMADVNSHKSYRPLTTLTFRANYLIFGLQPFWFHATNSLLHAAACLLFTRVCLSIARLQRTFAAIAGLLFAVHPIHTEAVTGIVGRADVLACIFFLISLLVYHGPESGAHYVGLSVLLGGLSMLAKETGITVFVLNLAFDFYRCWPCVKRTVVEVRWNDGAAQLSRRAAKVVLSLALLLAIRLALLQGSLPKFSQQDNPTAFHPSIYVRLMTFCYLAAFNWWLLLCPATLSHDWQMGSVPLVTTVSDSRNLVTCVACGAALLLIYRSLTDMEQQRHVPVVLGMLLLILPFLPAANLFVTVGFVVAERVLYIPSVGGVLVVTAGARAIWKRGRVARLVVWSALLVLLYSGAARTWQRNRDWSSRETLLRSGMAALPHNAKMHYNFANFLRDSNQPEVAVTHYNEALRLWPSYASAHNNLGTLIVETSKAERHFLAAIKYSRDHVNAHYNLGKLYRSDNRTEESLHMLERCVKLDPKFVLAYLELVNLKSEVLKGPLLKQVISLEPNKWEHYVRFAQWLENNAFRMGSLKMYLIALGISEKKTTHDKGDIISLRGACLLLRSFGQRSRILQLITRWHVGKRWGGAIHYARDVYLHQWKLRQELSSRANFYSPQQPLSQEDSQSNLRGRTCLDHSILDQSSVPRNINEYIVKPHIHNDGTHKHLNTFQTQKSINNKDPVHLGTLPPLANFNAEAEREEVSINEKINHNGFINVTERRRNISATLTQNCNKSSYQRDTESHGYEEKYIINTVNLNSSVTMDTHESLLRCNKSDLHRINLKRGRCFYAIRLGNMLKLCRKIKCRSNSKRSKHLKNGDYNTNGDPVTPWLIQHFVDAL